ncbi:MAG: hypothetical protein U5K54_25565 [Cytophagales bacterium]|nr:hypothetical protein [Cytophagales bacterium]
MNTVQEADLLLSIGVKSVETYHLTSRGEMNERLSMQLKNGVIQKQKQAARWQDKMEVIRTI